MQKNNIRHAKIKNKKEERIKGLSKLENIINENC